MHLQARTANEARYYLMVTPCPKCGKGPWVFGSADQTFSPADQGQQASPAMTVKATCRACSGPQEFTFQVQHDVPLTGSDSETINPASAPSELIDLAGWLSLFYLLLERASTSPDHIVSRKAGYQAALCLGEALKFYADDEDLPPESAFFTPTSQAIYREHPDNFSRQRLRDMQGKLPSMGVMARRLNRDAWVAHKKWWQFWRH